jgi:bifunctional non-homologous end joining protein LigD
MSHQNKKLKKSKQRILTSPLRKLPEKKASPRSSRKKSNNIVIDLREGKKDYSSIIEIALRKLSHSSKTKMPTNLKPMLATLVDEPFNDSNWQFEIKLDGYRTLAYIKSGKVDIRSRNNNSFNKKFSQVHEALTGWKINAVVDGEVVVLNEEGVPDFNSIQQWDKKHEGQLVYYVYDLLWLEGWDMMQEPLDLRREILKQLVPESGMIRFSDHIDEVGINFFDIAKGNHLEGIIAKKKDAPYLPGARSATWLKIKVEQRHEAVICGYTRKQDSDRLFSSLILGVYEKGELKYIGQTGTGFTAPLQKELLKKMRPHITRNCPFKEEPNFDSETIWLKPFLVCEVKYTELTNEGVMRHASFQGLREDKAAFELNNEVQQDTDIILEEAKEEKTVTTKQLIDTRKKQQLVTIDEHELKLTNLDKIYWPKEKITKGAMLNYYYSIAEYIMPYMKDRPQSLNRFPNGINGESFYHKNMAGKVDRWLKTFRRLSESSGEPKDFLICTNTASLLYMANLGCIEMNPWHSRVQNPHCPDWCVIDLDPGNITFDKVIETAQVVKEVLDSLQIPSYPKTSGSTGIHIYIPLGAKYNYEQSKQLAELIANLIHEELPTFTSLVRNPDKRKDKIYIDYLQNRPIQTICAPYSVRPKPGATVSTPLHWDEVRKGLEISDFTIKNVGERLKAEGELFMGVLGKGIDLNKVMKGLANLI